MDFGTVEKKEQEKIRAQDKMRLIPPSECKGAKRLPDEPFEDYKKRRKLENLSVRHYLKGRIVTPRGLM